ncbi:hypothetical protein ACQR16_32715 [Bradyrhizobium oligotrophicum]|uniref:hypothetical protein n=1 Tax=Bradyrhizobium oligotrophicum TaxID=44255 RepID=UPI003EC10AD5
MIALDTNVLLLLIVGLASPSYIAKHKCLGGRTVNDFEILKLFLEDFQQAVTLPNVLTEVSNLLGQTHGPTQPLFDVLRHVIANLKEICIPSIQASRRPEFARLQLADCALMEVAKDDVFILTTDGPLHRALLAAEYKTANFTHYMEAARD